MNIYECQGDRCKRTYYGQPERCPWCHSEVFTVLGPSEAPFDPKAHSLALKLTPEKFGQLSKLVDGMLKRRKRVIERARTHPESRPSTEGTAKTAHSHTR